MPDEQSQNLYDAPQSVEDVGPPPDGENPAVDIQSYEPPPEDPSGGALPPPPGSGLNLRLIIIIVVALLVVIGTIFGVRALLSGGSGAGGGGEVEIVYWGLWEPEEVMRQIITDFENEHPDIQVAYEMNSPIQYRERLQAAIERGEGPDVFRFHNTWIPMLSNNLASVPENVMSESEAQDVFSSSIVSDLKKANGDLAGLPYGVDTLMLFYNTQLLQSAGVSVPETWADFDEVASTLTVKNDQGVITRAGAAIGSAENVEHFSDILGLIMYQNGVQFPNVASQAGIQSLEFYTLFALQPGNVWDERQDNSIISFAAGNVAMIFAPSWQVHTIRALNPDLPFATAPAPQLGGGTPITWGTYWVEGVSAQSEHQEAAFTFISYLTEQETMTKLFAEASKLESRGFGEPYSRADLQNQLREQEYISTVAEQLPFMQSWYLASRTQDNGINDRIVNYFKDAVNAIMQGSSPSGAMETAARGVDQVLTEYDANE